MRKIDETIIHCTVTRPDWREGQTTAERVAEVKRWHTDPEPKGRGWRDIGYHKLIDRDGTVFDGRPISEMGAHCRGRNANSIGIALFGGHGSSANDPFSKNFTPEQDNALRNLIRELRATYGDHLKVSGHNEYAAKECPGFRVKNWLERKPSRMSLTQSNTARAGGAVVGVGGGMVSVPAIIGAAPKALDAVGGLAPSAQIALIVTGALLIALGGFVIYDRRRKWAAGDR